MPQDKISGKDYARKGCAHGYAGNRPAMPYAAHNKTGRENPFSIPYRHEAGRQEVRQKGSQEDKQESRQIDDADISSIISGTGETTGYGILADSQPENYDEMAERFIDQYRRGISMINHAADSYLHGRIGTEQRDYLKRRGKELPDITESVYTEMSSAESALAPLNDTDKKGNVLFVKNEGFNPLSLSGLSAVGITPYEALAVRTGLAMNMSVYDTKEEALKSLADFYKEKANDQSDPYHFIYSRLASLAQFQLNNLEAEQEYLSAAGEGGDGRAQS